MSLEALRTEYSSCCLCSELCANRTNVVFGVGDPQQAQVVIIGEAPGKYEDLHNEPFVGRSGQVLTQLLEEIGLSRSDVYITNTILCRPPQNRDPTRQELKNCEPRLNRQLSILNPQVVVTLGNFATKYMLSTNAGITQLHGRVHERGQRRIVPMFHPAVLLYAGNNPEKRKQLLDDFRVVKDMLSAGPSGQARLSDF